MPLVTPTILEREYCMELVCCEAEAEYNETMRLGELGIGLGEFRFQCLLILIASPFQHQGITSNHLLLESIL